MKKRVPVLVCVLSIILAVIIAFFASYAILSDKFKAKIAAYAGKNPSGSSSDPTLTATDKLSTIAALISAYSYYDVTEEDLCASIIGGYAYFKKDYYSAYYDEEDLKVLNEDIAGESQGIGVTVIHDEVNSCIKVVSVIKDGPAYKAGVKVNDRIIKVVGSDGNVIDLREYQYEAAMKMVQGKAGTTLQMTVARGDDLSEEVEFTILREPFTAESVMYHVSDVTKYNKKVGVVRITNFDLTTPTQFMAAMDDLIEEGCDYFVFDVRYNPGGDLASIRAVLSTMLNEGDVIISTKDRAGNEDITKCQTVAYSATSAYYGCSVTKEMIGKYRNVINGKSAVLTNGSTASAAELFTINLKDYDLSEIVGTKTYGKGSMQTMFDLSYYGYTGALKITTKKYFPPISEGYDGIGITPDIEVELADSLKDRNYFDISDTEDNQFQAAVTAIH